MIEKLVPVRNVDLVQTSIMAESRQSHHYISRLIFNISVGVDAGAVLSVLNTEIDHIIRDSI